MNDIPELGFAAEVRRPELMRWVLLIAMAALFLLTVFVGVVGLSKSIIVTAVMFAFAAFVGWFGRQLLMSDASKVMFDGETISDDTGEVICRLEDIDRIERGLALFKPTNGFVLTLKAEAPRGWSPGLWWRMGKRIGIGGATPGRAPRNMADAINLALMQARGEL